VQFDDLPIEPNRDVAIHVATHLSGMQAPLERDNPRGEASNRTKPKQPIHAEFLLLIVPFADSIVLDSRYRNKQPTCVVAWYNTGLTPRGSKVAYSLRQHGTC